MEVWENGCVRWAWMIDKLMMWSQVWRSLVGEMQTWKTWPLTDPQKSGAQSRQGSPWQVFLPWAPASRSRLKPCIPYTHTHTWYDRYGMYHVSVWVIPGTSPAFSKVKHSNEGWIGTKIKHRMIEGSLNRNFRQHGELKSRCIAQQ